MAYTKQNFKNGQTLTADHLNHIEDGIADSLPLSGGTMTGELGIKQGGVGIQLGTAGNICATDVGVDIQLGTAGNIYATDVHNGGYATRTLLGTGLNWGSDPETEDEVTIGHPVFHLALRGKNKRPSYIWGTSKANETKLARLDDVVPVLQSTGNYTDRTVDILEMLNTYGVCTLGKGDFFVRNLDMPNGTTLQGLGNASKIFLISDVTDGYAVQIGVHCTVQDVAIYGNASSRPSEVGTRHGIILKGDASGANAFATRWWPTITNCYIGGFTGGGITCHDTGTGLMHGLNVTNCKIYNCGAGINIDSYSEYHRFTNIVCYGNLYGCINNGGNNMFVNCMFSSNTIGFSITGAAWSSNSPNDSHGSAIGCTFNHNGSNAGPSIQIFGATCGYIFQGCQIFFGKIDIRNSKGIVFDGINIGRDQVINISGGGSVQFTNCEFANVPTFNITDNDNVIVESCHLWDGTEIFVNDTVSPRYALLSDTTNVLNSAKSYADSEIVEAMKTRAPSYTYGKTDLKPGVSSLETGKLYFVFE